MNHLELYVDHDLNDQQQHIWHQVVSLFAEVADEKVNVTDGAYGVTLIDPISESAGDKIATLWSEIYPADFRIE
jgi:hypothetical protein